MDGAAFTPGPNLLPQEGASATETPSTSAAETLQVPTNEAKIAYWQSFWISSCPMMLFVVFSISAPELRFYTALFGLGSN